MRTALVLGSAACLWADVEAALELGEFAGAVATNDAGVFWPGRLDAWVSLHAHLFRKWVRQREVRGLPDHHRLFGHDGAPSSNSRLSPAITDFVPSAFEGQATNGTSGLFALKVALLDLGFDRAVCCGMPMLDSAAHLLDTSRPWVGEQHGHHAGWAEALPHIADRARSMSGWTAGLLGMPDPEWLLEAA